MKPVRLYLVIVLALLTVFGSWQLLRAANEHRERSQIAELDGNIQRWTYYYNGAARRHSTDSVPVLRTYLEELTIVDNDPPAAATPAQRATVRELIRAYSDLLRGIESTQSATSRAP